MFATKETFAISIISWSLACFVYLLSRYYAGGSKFALKPYFNSITIGSLFSIFVGAVFFTNCFTRPSAILDAFETFFVYETTPGHEKPLLYYLELLVWPKYAIGTWWSEALVCLLSIIAVSFSVIRKKNLPFLLLVLVSTSAHILIYSCIAYKTPWLMLLPWAHACFLGALAFRTFDQETRLIKGSLMVLLVLGLTFQTKQSLDASGKFSNDARNPYAYVPTSKDLRNLQSWLVGLNAMQQIEPIAVVGSGYWPLPWYLKEFERVGYWPTVNDEMKTSPLVISMQSESEACTDVLKATHIPLPRGLRENVSIMLFLRYDLWQRWNEEAP
jgi:hypothetical protein